tara:strand:- start:634 stop:1629 length:996 start_codon:yes stop_codon:yes gene_type:complete
VNKILFLGCGSWGGALGSVLAEKGIPIKMWHRNSETVASMTDNRVHYLLPSIEFPANVEFTSDMEEAITNAQTVIIAIPSQSIRKLLQDNKSLFSGNQTIINVSKGLENGSLMTVSELIRDVLGDNITKIVTLSGPSHAEEVIEHQPTTLVSASSNHEAAEEVQLLFASENLRIYQSHDIKGVELGGSIKNVIAIAAGICDGIGFGDNSKAALLTRGIAEISRLGSAMGAELKTFNGLSGIGDLIVTCLSKHSRNRLVGQAIGEGKPLNEILSDMTMVAEGVMTSKSVHSLMKKYDVTMPISEAVYQILFKHRDPKESVNDLMERELKMEG